MRDGYGRGALPSAATPAQRKALAAYVAAGGSVSGAAKRVGRRPSTVKRHLADLRVRLAITWHPGEESDLATLVEVTFSQAPDGGTHVELLHTGWAVHGAEAAARAADYQQGLLALLEGFAKAA